MSQLGGDWQDFPASPVRATYPLAYYSVYNLTVSGSTFLENNHNAANQDAWQIGPRTLMSWQFRASTDAHRGATFIIHIGPIAEINPASSLHVWRCYKLCSGATAGIPQNNFSQLLLPPFMYAYFEVVSAEAGYALVGSIKLEAP